MCLFHSLADLLNLIHRSSTPNPCTELLNAVWDIKSWINPHLADTFEQHFHYHVYRFTMGGSGVVEMHYKQFSTMVWEPSKDGVQLAGMKLLLVSISA